jgi:hypothetical protein
MVGAGTVDAAATMGVVIVGAGSAGMVAGTVVMDTVVASCEMAWQLVQGLALVEKMPDLSRSALRSILRNDPRPIERVFLYLPPALPIQVITQLVTATFSSHAFAL